MQEQIDFTQEAADWLSGAFTRSETIERMVEMGCPEKEATTIIDGLIRQSWIKVLREIGAGVGIFVILGLIMILDSSGVIIEALGFFKKLGAIAAIALIGDGVRRAISLLVVTKR